MSCLGPVQTATDFNGSVAFLGVFLDNPWPCACPGASEINQNGTCVGSSKKSGFTQRNVPSSSPSKANHDDDDEAPGDRVDYAATLEGAYENLQKMLGDGGMKGLTSETKRLVDQQKNLMDSLNNMAPVLNSAKATLENLQMPDVKQIEQLMKGVTGKK